MARSFFVGTLAALILSLAAPATNAATLGVFTHVYGKKAALGQIDPTGDDEVFNGNVFISDQSTPSFADSFDLSSFSAGSIFSLSLTLKYAGTENHGEVWNVAVHGSNAAATTDDLTARLKNQLSPQTITLDASTDVGGISAFANSLTMKALSFRFFETTPGEDKFRLYSAELTVTGTVARAPAALPLPAAVPLPAGGLLLLGALAGLAGLRRRKTC